MEDKIARFKSRYINKFVRVTTKNQRVFYGKFIAIDDKANILLYETVTEIPQHLSHPVNQTLVNVLDSKLIPERYINVSGLPEENGQ
jgi:small nuclear ribonucleoprotein (snRNP)-like protein